MWEPARLDDKYEERLESIGATEEDRLEVRRFAEYLRWRKLKAGGGHGPVRPEMYEWLYGKEAK